MATEFGSLQGKDGDRESIRSRRQSFGRAAPLPTHEDGLHLMSSIVELPVGGR